MAKITDDMRRFIAAQRLSYVATVSPEGRPNVSPKASLQVLDDDHLVFTDIASPGTMSNLRHNPYVEINVIDIFGRRGYRFRGKGEILTSGPLYEEMKRQLHTNEGPQYPANAVVRIRIEEARPLVSPAYQFNDDADEGAIRSAWLKRYGYRLAESDQPT